MIYFCGTVFSSFLEYEMKHDMQISVSSLSISFQSSKVVMLQLNCISSETNFLQKSHINCIL